MIEAGQKAPSMFSLISKSVFGWTGYLCLLLMVLMQLYGGEIIKWIGGIYFPRKDALDAKATGLSFKKSLTLNDGKLG